MRKAKGPIPPSRLIEQDVFPFEFISVLAEKESWRKEIYRPIYHVHKWWAKRLGSVFRGILIGCLLPENADLRKAFYQKRDGGPVSVFDPFMGSGTTIGEAHKLGLAALGRDINPVACESVRVALGPLDRRRIQEAFLSLADTVGKRIRALYQSTDDRGIPSEVLYYFWVKNIPCPHCKTGVDLFSSRIIARNAYPDRKPEVQVCCPRCGCLFPSHNRHARAECSQCGFEFDPHSGPAKGTQATCPKCTRPFEIIEAVRALEHPPTNRLIGKLLLTAEGNKRYAAATPEDVAAYERCSAVLRRELAQGNIRLPDGVLADGFNTRQAIGYNYRTWRDFFNDRQLLALGWLQEAIATLPEAATREALMTLFSGVLEFNNMFASYKGEGTGAVRHMFSHHILKPERTPIEANVWGTHKSSGSFSNLFKSRLMRALDYRDSPFEVALGGLGNKRLASDSFSGEIAAWPVQGNFRPRGIYLSCGSSDATGLPDQCIDFVVTDPPFFDNVHYSELADFFYAWQHLYPRGFLKGAATTRHPREVQDANAEHFASKLGAVFSECRRVLKEDGLLVFTYHHSRPQGWTSLASALVDSGFSVVNAHPVKAELSLATPKSQAKEPIQLDVIFVCRRIERDHRKPTLPQEALDVALAQARRKADRLTSIRMTLSLNDRRVIVLSQFIAALGPQDSVEVATKAILDNQARLEEAALALPALPEDVPQPEPMLFSL